MLFLTDVDYVSFEKTNETRQNNLQSATVSLQVVIGLCKRKETAALKSKPPFQMGVSNCLLYDGFFSFAAVRQLANRLFLFIRIIIKSKCHRNVRAELIFDRKTG